MEKVIVKYQNYRDGTNNIIVAIHTLLHLIDWSIIFLFYNFNHHIQLIYMENSLGIIDASMANNDGTKYRYSLQYYIQYNDTTLFS